MSGSSVNSNFVVKNGLTVGSTEIVSANGTVYVNQLRYQGNGGSITDVANGAFTKANNSVQTAFVTVSANGNSITSSSNNDTLTITSATANGINVLNPTSKTIDLGLRTSGVTAGSYGTSTAIPAFTVDEFGRITSASTNSVSTTINLTGTTGSGSVSGGGTLTFASNNGFVVSSTGGSTLYLNSAQDLQTSASPTFNNLTVAGNLSVAGTYTYSNTVVFQSVDSLIELAANNTGDVVDIGFYGQYSSNKYAGLVRTGGGNFALFKELSAPTSNSFGSITLGNYGTLRANLTGGMVTALANTIGISDGGTNNASYTTGAALQYNGTSIVSLANTGTAGTYGSASYVPVVTTDAYGRISSVSNTAIAIDTAALTSGTLGVSRGGTNNTSYTTGALLQYNGSGIVSIANTGVTAGSYGNTTSIPSITVDAYGRVTAVSNNSVSTTINLAGTTGSGSVAGGGTLTFASNNGVVISSTGGSTLYINDPQDLQTSASPSFNNLTVAGNLSVAGTYTYSNTVVFQSVDSLIELAANNTGDVVDIGFYGQYSSNKYAGLVRTGGGNFALFKELSAPTSNSFGSITLGNYGTLRANLTGGMVTALANTIGISDGGTNNASYTTGAALQYNGTSIVSLANTGTAGTYGSASYVPVVTTDAYGRISSVSNTAIAIDTAALTSGTLGVSRGGTNNTSYTTGALLQYNGSGIVSIANTGVTAGSYGNTTSIPSITVDAYGRVTAVSNNSVSTTINLAGTTGSGSVAGGGTLTFASNNGVVISSTGGSTLYINDPQDLQTSASPSFNAVTLNTNGYVTSKTFTTSSTAQVAIDSFATATYRSAKYMVQMTSGSSYHVIELIVLHDGTIPSIAQYGEIFTGSSLGTFDASITTGNLSLLLTATNATTVVKMVRTNIAV